MRNDPDLLLGVLGVAVIAAKGEGDYAAVVRLLNKMLKEETDLSGRLLCLRVRAEAKFELEDYSGCIADYSECLKDRPDQAPVVMLRMRAYRRSGMTAEALEDCAHLLRLADISENRKAIKEYRRLIEAGGQ